MRTVEFTDEQFKIFWNHLNNVCFSAKDCDKCPLNTTDHMKCIMTTFDKCEDAEDKTVELTDEQFGVLKAYTGSICDNRNGCRECPLDTKEELFCPGNVLDEAGES